jgi:hypothetical protein
MTTDEMYDMMTGRDRDHAADYARMPDAQLFGERIFWTDDQAAAYNVELRKRKALREQQQQAKDREQQRIAQERAAALNRRKDALQFSDALATEICERISAGELLTVICLDEHLPTVRRFNLWLKTYPELNKLFEVALQDRLVIFEDDTIRICDEAARDFDIVTDKKGRSRRILDPAKIQAARQRVECRFRHLKAGSPQKWGDSSTLSVKSEDPFDPSNLSAESLEKMIADIEAKDRVLRPAKVA